MRTEELRGIEKTFDEKIISSHNCLENPKNLSIHDSFKHFNGKTSSVYGCNICNNHFLYTPSSNIIEGKTCITCDGRGENAAWPDDHKFGIEVYTYGDREALWKKCDECNSSGIRESIKIKLVI